MVERSSSSAWVGLISETLKSLKKLNISVICVCVLSSFSNCFHHYEACLQLVLKAFNLTDKPCELQNAPKFNSTLEKKCVEQLHFSILEARAVICLTLFKTVLKSIFVKWRSCKYSSYKLRHWLTRIQLGVIIIIMRVMR